MSEQQQQIEDTYRLSRHRLAQRAQEFRQMPEIRAYVEDRLVLIRHFLATTFAGIPCIVSSLYQQEEPEGELDVDINIGFILEIDPFFGIATQLTIRRALREYLEAVERHPVFLVDQDQVALPPVLLLPSRCSSLLVHVREEVPSR